MNQLDKIQDIVAEVLYVEREEVNPDAKLIGDLGAESIDFLDLVFRLEQEFDIKIPKGATEADARGELSEEEFAADGVILEKGLEQLKKALPEVNPNDIKAGLYVRDIPSLFTVRTFDRMVSEQLGKGESVVAVTGPSTRKSSPSVVEVRPATGTDNRQL